MRCLHQREFQELQQKKEQTCLMQPLKSLRSVRTLRTQKHFREALRKQDFYQSLISALAQQLSPEEHQFLYTYLLPQRLQRRQQNRGQPSCIGEPRKSNISQEPIGQSMSSLSSDIFVSSHKLAWRRPKPSLVEQIALSRKNIASIREHKEHLESETSDSFSRRRKNVHQSKQNCPPQKFHAIQPSDKSGRQQSRAWTRETQRPSRFKVISRDQLLNNYGDRLVKNIFDKPLIPSETDEEFSDNFENRHTEEMERHRQAQDKYRNLTSIQFWKSPRKRPRIKIHARKF